ncbi:MAG: hypothetical protein ABFR75_07435 [Acidobacteriota bacterium]
MYDKKQIIAEIKRVSKVLKVKNLRKSDFINNTMIPISTINFYISSWEDILIEAGLEKTEPPEKPVTDEELLKDLLRLEKEFGEIPTFSIIASDGKFSKKDYLLKWRSIEDAIKIAKNKYGKSETKFLDKTILKKPGKSKSENSKNDADIHDKTILKKPEESKAKDSNDLDIDFEETMVSRRREDLGIEKVSKKPVETSSDLDFSNILDSKEREEPEKVEPEFDYITDDVGIEDILSKTVPKQKKKQIIPETIKPKIKKKEKNKAEYINFRGIKTAPVDVNGVIFIFGLICEELSFIIEKFNSDLPCFEGKRSLNSSGTKMEDVKLGFFYKSSDLKKKTVNNSDFNILICWTHDWNDCPVEVLELKAVLKLLDT